MSEFSNGYCNSNRPNSDSHSNLNNLYKFCKDFGLKDRANEFLKERDKTPVDFLPSPTATLHVKSPMLKEIIHKTEKLNENHIHNILGSIGMPLPRKYTKIDDHRATYILNYFRKHYSLHSKKHIKGKPYHSHNSRNHSDSDFFITPAKLKKKVKHKQQNKKDNHNNHKPKKNTPKIA